MTVFHITEECPDLLRKAVVGYSITTSILSITNVALCAIILYRLIVNRLILVSMTLIVVGSGTAFVLISAILTFILQYYESPMFRLKENSTAMAPSHFQTVYYRTECAFDFLSTFTFLILLRYYFRDTSREDNSKAEKHVMWHLTAEGVLLCFGAISLSVASPPYPPNIVKQLIKDGNLTSCAKLRLITKGLDETFLDKHVNITSDVELLVVLRWHQCYSLQCLIPQIISITLLFSIFVKAARPFFHKQTAINRKRFVQPRFMVCSGWQEIYSAHDGSSCRNRAIVMVSGCLSYLHLFNCVSRLLLNFVIVNPQITIEWRIFYFEKARHLWKSFDGTIHAISIFLLFPCLMLFVDTSQYGRATPYSQRRTSYSRPAPGKISPEPCSSLSEIDLQ